VVESLRESETELALVVITGSTDFSLTPGSKGPIDQLIASNETSAIFRKKIKSKNAVTHGF
jgi:hypothetical protein